MKPIIIHKQFPLLEKEHSKMIQSNMYNNVGRHSGKMKDYIFHFQLHFPIMVFS